LITNKVSGKYYIGSSTNIKSRWKTHLRRLKGGIHANQHLLNSYAKHGKESFIFSILEEVGEKFLIEREQFYMDKYQSYDRLVGYNILRFAGTTKGYKHTPDTIEKIRKSSTGRKHSEEVKEKIRRGNINKVFSKETRKKMSEAKLGKKLTKSHYENLCKARRSPTNRKRMSDFAKTRTGIKNPNSRLTEEQVCEIRKLFVNGKHKRQEIADMYGVSLSTIKRLKAGTSYR